MAYESELTRFESLLDEWDRMDLTQTAIAQVTQVIYHTIYGNLTSSHEWHMVSRKDTAQHIVAGMTVNVAEDIFAEQEEWVLRLARKMALLQARSYKAFCDMYGVAAAYKMVVGQSFVIETVG